ncbi:DUF2721 domain-containing protein [Synechococcus sp. PCC 6312]|uniref:DUF2721 domain-containing protein n=1 Tax=Synechococcus sp. (strain ATCC 27167 / PCC 6312) TaxID=195253 RepID=UPI00029F49CF|nr:DUF2721 domain-containing protein [Synechococcus sp. PCC 6312]AFY59921.1 Protein of unknown function (DUF2721) [Synechococcus sp. PCC 6312]
MDASATRTLVIIQDLLAPSVMLMSQALFLLGLSGRRALVFNNISALEQNKIGLQALISTPAEHHLSPQAWQEQLERFAHLLQQRNRYVLYSVWSHIAAIICFVFTSLAIGLNLYAPNPLIQDLTWGLFVAGLVFTVLGLVALGVDEWLSHCMIGVHLTIALLVGSPGVICLESNRPEPMR